MQSGILTLNKSEGLNYQKRAMTQTSGRVKSLLNKMQLSNGILSKATGFSTLHGSLLSVYVSSNILQTARITPPIASRHLTLIRESGECKLKLEQCEV
jgi:hypothetical protein